ncbi:transcription antitermination factor NusB [Conchiformibius steedae]|uniref:Transcription antitermination protein NusB n=1 Tax=Conchiformibius steedae TaxID=153493 RepID=A0A3P2A7T0_9NEIS|nr:transcription antitermination factor NusB [Conchiformibius steedae]RRD89673.1 transcription antitermination factor NusB [Conchiformibius steedae]
MNKTKTPRRRRSREFVVQALYQSAINHTPAPEIAANIRASRDFVQADADLFTQIFFGAHQNRANYDNLLAPLIERDLKTVNPIEKSVLLMAVYELKEMPQTPYPVIINEAIEVTKTFGGTDSHRFVNGILDKLAVSLRPHEIKRAPST